MPVCSRQKSMLIMSKRCKKSRQWRDFFSYSVLVFPAGGGQWRDFFSYSVLVFPAGGGRNWAISHLCHCEGVRPTLKTLAYDCGNPVIICLRAFARSAFLFTWAPWSSHGVTKGSKCPSPRPCHSRARGPRKHEYVCGVDKAGIGLGLLLVI